MVSDLIAYYEDVSQKLRYQIIESISVATFKNYITNLGYDKETRLKGANNIKIIYKTNHIHPDSLWLADECDKWNFIRLMMNNVQILARITEQEENAVLLNIVDQEKLSKLLDDQNNKQKSLAGTRLPATRAFRYINSSLLAD